MAVDRIGVIFKGVQVHEEDRWLGVRREEEQAPLSWEG
jgi:hypothetical protein